LIFISYSHKDEEWKDRILTHICIAQKQELFDVWDDRRIEGGEDWFEPGGRYWVALRSGDATNTARAMLRDIGISNLVNPDSGFIEPGVARDLLLFLTE